MSIGIPSSNPLDYTGPQQNIAPIRFFPRRPTTTDKKYRVGQLVIIGKNPSSGSEGDIWYLSRFNSSGDAIWVELLSGAASPGIDSVTTDDGAPEVEPDVNGNINILGGAGIVVSGQGPGDTVTISATGFGMIWSVISSATQAITIQNGYFANRGAGVTFTLPATAEVGDTFSLSAINAGGWTLAQNAGQTIHFGNQDTTTGVGGSLATTAIGDTITVVCSVQNTDFVVISSIGNITFV